MLTASAKPSKVHAQYSVHLRDLDSREGHGAGGSRVTLIRVGGWWCVPRFPVVAVSSGFDQPGAEEDISRTPYSMLN